MEGKKIVGFLFTVNPKPQFFSGDKVVVYLSTMVSFLVPMDVPIY